MKNQLENQKSREIFFEYKKLASIELDNYNYLKGKFPDQSFPKSAACAWRMGVLAEFWRQFHLTVSGIS